MTAPHDKLAGIAPGDRVEMRIQGEFVRIHDDGHIDLMVDGSRLEFGMLPGSVAADTFQIERIETPLIVGSKARIKGGLEEWEVVALDGGMAWIKSDRVGHSSLPQRDLERIP